MKHADWALPFVCAALALGCQKSTSEQAPKAPPAAKSTTPAPEARPVAPASPPGGTDDAPKRSLDREAFNRLAVRQDLPLVWTIDTENPGTLDPAELTVLRGERSTWLSDDGATPELKKVMADLGEQYRRALVEAELDSSRVTVIESDFSKLTDEDRAVMRHLEKAAALVDALYRTQTGAAALEAELPTDHPPSRALFRRNNGPACEAPGTVGNPFCSALPNFREPRSMAWPDDVELNQDFCDAIGKAPNAAELQDPFSVVRKKGDGYEALPYTAVYGDQMRAVATELEAAAAAITSEDEAAFKAYLLAAANGFKTNVWWDADEAWSKMNGRNSKWYLRIGPDETYFDPCQLKSGFHVSLARIDQSAREWQDKLTEMRTEMEQTIAGVIGEPYAAREVGFEVPEFIDIIINAGDSRAARGATIGQSLPNFGKVAEESRGRTVAMANLYTDPDSMRISKARATSLFTPAAMANWSEDPSAGRLDTVLHEAMHNFGPTGSWKVDGKAPEAIFGGRLDAIMEELKAQTGSYVLLGFLHKKEAVTDAELRSGFLSSLAWTMGHIANGMFTPSGKPRTYSVLSAIQLKWFVDAGAMVWVAEDGGRWEVKFDKVGPAADALMKTVGGIKARGDRDKAQALVDDATSETTQKALHFPLITERVQAFPKASFVYAIRYQ